MEEDFFAASAAELQEFGEAIVKFAKEQQK